MMCRVLEWELPSVQWPATGCLHRVCRHCRCSHRYFQQANRILRSSRCQKQLESIETDPVNACSQVRTQHVLELLVGPRAATSTFLVRLSPVAQPVPQARLIRLTHPTSSFTARGVRPVLSVLPIAMFTTEACMQVVVGASSTSNGEIPPCKTMCEVPAKSPGMRRLGQDCQQSSCTAGIVFTDGIQQLRADMNVDLARDQD